MPDVAEYSIPVLEDKHSPPENHQYQKCREYHRYRALGHHDTEHEQPIPQAYEKLLPAGLWQEL
ncbi:hypothetical protein F441_22778 [Phytophthora nicotianae CJ01A1]|uniref:Uncharacterized protein n=1 Tax=Phytophthora nicotianae CJ01A1 TaxID=1317063 RepID=W2VQX5_PHYNI|nr:hypothetical protein F441_22778 [Phytophthora nicotianae CJ01A1]